MIDISLFFIGALGALLTVYLAKQEVIPEFRPLFDTSEKEKEAMEHRKHINETEKHIDNMQIKLEEKSLPDGDVTRLVTVLKTSQDELRDERTRLQTLEREIKQNQFISRGAGFVIYIALGGVFGSLLAGRLQIEGLSGDLPDFFESLLIGATWTSYLSNIGFSSVQKKVDGILEARRKESAEKYEAIKKEITEIVAQEVAKAEKTDKVEQPFNADKVARIVADKLDSAMFMVQGDSNLTRQMVQREIKGIL